MYIKFLRHLILSVLLLILSACISGEKKKNKENGIDQLQLQEEIQRFYSRFTERIVEAILKNEQLTYHFRLEILKEYTLYDSEALKIATSPYPVINLLDMVVFIKLNKSLLASYWVPKVYGKSGEELLHAFEESEKDILQISHKLLTPQQSIQLNQVIKKWLKENPNTFRVEKIRFGDFSEYAHGASDKNKSFSISNMIVDTESAVKAVDQMVLVANRGIFLAQHMPLIVRLHTRIGTQEVIQDTISTMQSAPKLMKEMNQAKPILQELITLTEELDHLAKDSQSVFKSIQGSFPKGLDVHRGFQQADSLIGKTTGLLHELRSGKKPGHLTEELKQFIWFAALVLILVGICISAAWWTGYYISKRMLKNRSGN